MDQGLYQILAEELIVTVHEAGKAMMKVYQDDSFQIETKQDASPVTIADKQAEKIILDSLAKLMPDIPIISEEAASEGIIPEIDNVFFLVDPLDGTKEFISKRLEFTINIGLIENQRPVFGIVYAPALHELYLTIGNNQAVYGRLDPDASRHRLEDIEMKPLKVTPPSDDGFNIVASKSHMTVETETFLKSFKVRERKDIGSSLKFCLLAKGEADLYPRFGPTMEWDTAAAHAILNAAGGIVLQEDMTPLIYKKKESGYKNPFFIAFGDRNIAASYEDK